MNFDDGILYDYNIEAYKKLIKSIEEDGRACAIHSTGTGKMYLALKWLIDNKEESFAYVAPTNIILDRFLDVIINERFPDKKEELYELKTIEKRIKRIEKLLGNRVHLLTYQGIHKKVKKGKEKLKADKIVLDEFHHLGANQWGSSVEKFLQYNEEAEILGLSATPIRSDKKDMVEELFNDKIASQISLEDSLEKEILPVPTFIGAIYSFKEEIDKLENKFKSKKYSKETEEKIEKYIKEARKVVEEAGGIKEVFDFALTKIQNKKNAKFIVFCSDIKDKDNKIKEAHNWFDGNLDIKSVDYSLGKKESWKVIKEFEEDKSEGIKLLFSIDMLNEGLHVKDIDGVIMMRPTESNIIFHQQLGRALSSGSKKGIKPLVLDLSNNLEVLENDVSNTKELIVKYGGNVYGGTHTEIPSFSIQWKMINIINYLRGLSYTFEERISPLIEYYKEHGSVENIKFVDTYNGSNIGNLIFNLRKEYKTGKLNEEQISLLEKIGMTWNVKTTFEERIAPLFEYYKMHGSISNIKKGTIINYEGKELNIGELIFTLRKQYKYRQINELEHKEDNNTKFNHRPLTDNEISILESIGMIWNARVDFESRTFFLFEYYKEHGTLLNIKFDDVYHNVNIGHLISALRKEYKKGKLNEKEIKKLEEIGMIWSAKPVFEERISPLFEYYKEYGTIKNVKFDDIYHNVSIGHLINNLRREYKAGKLSEEEIKKLDELGMPWKQIERKKR